MPELALAEASEGLDGEDLAHLLQLVRSLVVSALEAVPTAQFVESQRLYFHLVPKVSHGRPHVLDLLEDGGGRVAQLVADHFILTRRPDYGLHLLELVALDALPGARDY